MEAVLDHTLPLAAFRHISGNIFVYILGQTIREKWQIFSNQPKVVKKISWQMELSLHNTDCQARFRTCISGYFWST